MTTASVATRRGNCTFDFGDAQVRAHRHHLATVVTIRGEIDAINVDAISGHIGRFTLAGNAVVLDLSDVSNFAAPVISLLHTFDSACAAAGVEWTLVAGPEISDLLGDEARFSVVRSVHEALGNLADAIASRRRLVLPLIRKTA